MTWGRAAIHICEALKQQAEAVVRAARKQGIPAAVPDEMLLPATLIAVAKRWMGYHMHELHRSSWAPIVMRLRNKLLDAFLESNPHAGVIVMHTRKSRDDDRSIQVDLYSSKETSSPREEILRPRSQPRTCRWCPGLLFSGRTCVVSGAEEYLYPHAGDMRYLGPFRPFAGRYGTETHTCVAMGMLCCYPHVLCG